MARVSRLRNQSKLLEHGDAIVQTQLFGKQAVLNFEDGDAGEVDLLARVGRQRADRNVVESRAGMRAATFPLSDHIVTLTEQLGRTPEVQVRKGRAEPGGELADLVAATGWGMH